MNTMIPSRSVCVDLNNTIAATNSSIIRIEIVSAENCHTSPAGVTASVHNQEQENPKTESVVHDPRSSRELREFTMDP